MQLWLDHLNELEVSVCRTWTRSGERQWIQRPFAVISRLGGEGSLLVTAAMAAAAAALFGPGSRARSGLAWGLVM